MIWGYTHLLPDLFPKKLILQFPEAMRERLAALLLEVDGTSGGYGGGDGWMPVEMGGKTPPKWMVKIMEQPMKIHDLGVPLFLETPT